MQRVSIHFLTTGKLKERKKALLHTLHYCFIKRPRKTPKLLDC